MGSHDTFLLFSIDHALYRRICDWIEPAGWRCVSVGDEESLIACASNGAAILLIDGRSDIEGLEAVVRVIRRLPGRDASLPILLLTQENGGRLPGANQVLTEPMTEEAFRQAVEQWAGPLDDSGFRDIGSNTYALTRLAGRDHAMRLLDNFAHSLAEALARIDAGGDVPSIAHQIAGIAGVVGYASLGAAWSAAVSGGAEELKAARLAAKDVLADLRSGGRHPLH
jgi:CheY-like chemotaxis protein